MADRPGGGAPEAAIEISDRARTSDAHGLYAQFGFTPVARPEDLLAKRTEPPRDPS
jgi:hypothetical protein